MKNCFLRKKCLESISVQAASLSLLNIIKFYYSYIDKNQDKLKRQLEQKGYFCLKNKLSTGSSGSNSKDIYISTYFINEDKIYECNMMLNQKYYGNVDANLVGGFFIPDTNELVVLAKVYDLDYIEDAIVNSDIRSTIEHELTHAFDHTSKIDKLANQHTIGVGTNAFLSACVSNDIISKDEFYEIRDSDSTGTIFRCLYAISLILYKLFTVTEFNAHQMSGLRVTHGVDHLRQDRIKKIKDALKFDIEDENKLEEKTIQKSLSVTPEEFPLIWKIVGRVLKYMGYNITDDSPKAVYSYFKAKSIELFNKFYVKKLKNQVKYIISLKEKNTIKEKLIECIVSGKIRTGVSFWFRPVGQRDSYLCRIKVVNNSVVLLMNNREQKIYGNADSVYKRALEFYNSSEQSSFEFAIDNLVDILTQSLERAFNKISYDPFYDMTVPQDEEQLDSANKISSRFADLDWD